MLEFWVAQPFSAAVCDVSFSKALAAEVAIAGGQSPMIRRAASGDKSSCPTCNPSNSAAAKVSAVVHDQLDTRTQPHSEFTRLIEHLPGTSPLVAILDQSASGGDERLRRQLQITRVRKTAAVKDWIQTRR